MSSPDGNFQWSTIKAQTRILAISLVMVLPILLAVSAKAPNLTFVVAVVVTVMLVVYAGSIAKALLRGYMAGPVVDSLYMAGPVLAVFIILAMKPSQFPEEIGGLAIPMLLLGSAVAVNPVAKARRGHVPVVIRSLILLFAGALLMAIASMVGQESWGGAIFLGLAVSGAIGLLGAFHQHSNTALREVGRALQSSTNNALLAVLLVGVSVYVICIRPSVDHADPVVLAAEWGAVVAAVLGLAVLAKRRLAVLRAEEGDLDIGAVMAAPILASSDLAQATESVRAFVDRGESQRVIVMLVSALKANGLDDAEVAGIIGELVRYREESLALTWTWTYGDVLARRKRDRALLLSKALKSASMSAVRKRGAAGRP